MVVVIAFTALICLLVSARRLSWGRRGPLVSADLFLTVSRALWLDECERTDNHNRSHR